MSTLGLSADLQADLMQALPRLRAFAISLTGNVDDADDLAHDTVVRALGHIDHFEPGTNLQAWLFTILRNAFYSRHRRRRREIEDPDGAMAEKLSVMPAQGAHLHLEDVRSALAKLSPQQREAILLVGAEGLSYEEASEVCGVLVGTIKSRVNRARSRLVELLSANPETDFGPDPVIAAAVGEIG